MNGSDELFVDTNLFIYYFGGINAAKQALRDKKLHFSFITEIELLGTANISYAQEKMIKEVLSFQTKHSYLPEIERMTIAIKKHKRSKYLMPSLQPQPLSMTYLYSRPTRLLAGSKTCDA